MLKLAFHRALKEAITPTLGVALVHLLTTHFQEGVVSFERTLIVSACAFVAVALLVFLPMHYKKLEREQRGE